MSLNCIKDRDAFLADLQMYLGDGHLEAAVELLLEEQTSLIEQPTLLKDALESFRPAVAAKLAADDLRDLPRFLDVLFDLTPHASTRLRSTNERNLLVYKRALLASRTPPYPLERVLRHGTLLDLFRRTAGLKGGVAECGCAAGLSFLQLCQVQRENSPAFQGEGFHVFDSFQGLSEPGRIDVDFSGMSAAEAKRVANMTQAGNFAHALEAVSRHVLPDFPRAELHAGWIPERFADVAGQRFRFVHVDVDLYAPTLASFQFFHPRLVAGGIIVTDDYNWPGGRRAVDTFCAELGLRPELTSTNQAYLVAAA